MYGGGHDPAPSGGQQSAFSHPPNLGQYTRHAFGSLGPQGQPSRPQGQQSRPGSPSRYSPAMYASGQGSAGAGAMTRSYSPFAFAGPGVEGGIASSVPHYWAPSPLSAGGSANPSPAPSTRRSMTLQADSLRAGMLSSDGTPHDGVSGRKGKARYVSRSRKDSEGDASGNGTDYDQDEEEDDDVDEEDDDEVEDDDEEDLAYKLETRESSARISGASRAAAKRKRGDKDDLISTKDASATQGAARRNSQDAEGNSVDGRKSKPMRGSKACTHCRRLKMRCMGAENGPPCARCRQTGHECIFQKSNRGKKGGKNTQQRTEAMWQSLRKMEATLNTVLAGISEQHSLRRGPVADALASVVKNVPPSVSPSSVPAREKGAWLRTNEVLPRTRFAEPELLHKGPQQESSAQSKPSVDWQGPHGPVSTDHGQEPRSPRLQMLPDNTLNPLGLLAEASLHNHSRLKKVGTPGRPSKGSTAQDGAEPSGRSSGASVAGLSPEASKAGPSRDSVRSANATAIKVDLDKDPAAAAEAKALDFLVTKSKSRSSQSGGTMSMHDTEEGMENEPNRAGTTEEEAGGVRTTTGDVGTSSQSHTTDSQASLENLPDKPQLGVASETYFRPGFMTILPLRRITIEREMPPELLTEGIVSSQEVLELFRIFFLYVGQHLVLLDPDWHTPTMICSRSPFLFTCVLAVASKFYLKRPDLHAKCLAKARKSAFAIMSRGFKSVEICQGFLLLTHWSQPAERFETDRTWLFSGVAIRIATDLNLHRKSSPVMTDAAGRKDDSVLIEREREIRNRERTWLFCFSTDRNISGQMGKPWTIREDWIIRNVGAWGRQRHCLPWDFCLSASVDLARLVSRQLDFLYSSTASASGLNTEIDYQTVLSAYNRDLEEWWEERVLSEAGSKGLLKNEPPPSEDENYALRTTHYISRQAPLRFNYYVLILNSFGLQHAMDFPEQSGLDRGFYFSKCYLAARRVILAARDGLEPVLGYAPDLIFIIISYACVFLLKLSQPTFAQYAGEEQMIDLVREGADLLERVAMHPTHTPALYATFLRALLHARLGLTERSGHTTPFRSRAASPAVESDARDHRGKDGHAATLKDLSVQGMAISAAAKQDGDRSANGNGNARTIVESGAATIGTPISAQSTSDALSAPLVPSQHQQVAQNVQSHHHAHVHTSTMPDDIRASFGGLAATLPGATAGVGFGTAGPGEQAAAVNTLDPSLAADSNHGMDAATSVQEMLQNSWWSSLLPPGFGAATAGSGHHSLETFESLGSDVLSALGNTGLVPNLTASSGASGMAALGAGMTPGHSRSATPTQLEPAPEIQNGVVNYASIQQVSNKSL